MLRKYNSLNLVSKIRGNSLERREASRRVHQNMMRSAVLILEVLTLKKRKMTSNSRTNNQDKVHGPLQVVESEIQMQENHNYSKVPSHRTTNMNEKNENVQTKLLMHTKKKPRSEASQCKKENLLKNTSSISLLI